jgi:hypothetical protein
LSDGELNEKFLMNCGDSRAALELRDAIWSIEDEASLDRLHDLATATAVEELRVA